MREVPPTALRSWLPPRGDFGASAWSFPAASFTPNASGTPGRRSHARPGLSSIGTMQARGPADGSRGLGPRCRQRTTEGARVRPGHAAPPARKPGPCAQTDSCLLQWCSARSQSPRGLRGAGLGGDVSGGARCPSLSFPESGGGGAP